MCVCVCVCVCVCACMCTLRHLSFFLLCSTLWTVAHQAPLSMEFSRQEYWSGLLCPPPGDLPNPGIEPASPTLPVLAGRFFTLSQGRSSMGKKKREEYKGLSIRLTWILKFLYNLPPWAIHFIFPSSTFLSYKSPGYLLYRVTVIIIYYSG